MQWAVSLARTNAGGENSAVQVMLRAPICSRRNARSHRVHAGGDVLCLRRFPCISLRPWSLIALIVAVVHVLTAANYEVQTSTGRWLIKFYGLHLHQNSRRTLRLRIETIWDYAHSLIFQLHGARTARSGNCFWLYPGLILMIQSIT